MSDNSIREQNNKITAYLTKIERDLKKSGMDPQQREVVVSALHEQIADTMADLGPDTDIDAVLKSIDAPGLEPRENSANLPASGQRIGWISLSLALLVAGIAYLLLPLLSQSLAHQTGPGFFILGELMALVLGILARQSSAGKAGIACSSAALALFGITALFGS